MILRGRPCSSSLVFEIAAHQRPNEHWPLFGGLFVEALMDSEQLVLKHGRMRRTLDFRNLTVTDTR
jgi:hypothetical protein